MNLAELTWERYVVNLESRDRYQLYEGAFLSYRSRPWWDADRRPSARSHPLWSTAPHMTRSATGVHVSRWSSAGRSRASSRSTNPGLRRLRDLPRAADSRTPPDHARHERHDPGGAGHRGRLHGGEHGRRIVREPGLLELVHHLLHLRRDRGRDVDARGVTASTWCRRLGRWTDQHPLAGGHPGGAVFLLAVLGGVAALATAL